MEGKLETMTEPKRCPWAKHELDHVYHDNEWGKPLLDDRALFEMLILEGMQAGLSWLTILKKRDSFRAAFDCFVPETVAEYGGEKLATLLADPGIIRNRLKLTAAVGNAKAFLRVREEFGGFRDYIWGFVNGVPIVNAWETPEQLPVSTPLSDAMSKDLKKRGFRFVGTTICYSYMQAVGMVNDHMVWCDQYHNCKSR